MNKYKYIPEGYNAVTPALAFKGAATAINWYKKIFDAKEKMRFDNPDKTIGHAELIIGDSVVFVSDENPEFNKSPRTLNGNSVNLFVYVQDADAVIRNAVDNGAQLIKPAEDQFYGDRSGRIQDPFGYLWIVSTHVKDVSEEEMHKKMKEMAAQN